MIVEFVFQLDLLYTLLIYKDIIDMRTELPDPDISLRDATEFILDSRLGRTAMCYNEFPHFPNFLRDLIAYIYRLVGSCHLSEFTDHGLSHLCSLVDRISRWTVSKKNCESIYLLDMIRESIKNKLGDEYEKEFYKKAAVLLIATLIHDIGMLSQKAEDLDPTHEMRYAKGRMEISEWVRGTHVDRIPRLVRRLFENQSEFGPILNSEMINSSFDVAKAHQKWPWKEGFINLEEINRALAAIVAVSDLLDEDSNRCDTNTLINHRDGTVENKAHWIRHSLTANRVLINGSTINIELVRPPETDNQFDVFYTALKNHYRLVQLYSESLELIGAKIQNVDFEPNNGIPVIESGLLKDWNQINGFQTQEALLFHLLRTFFPESRLETQNLSADVIEKLRNIGVEEIDLKRYHNIRGNTGFRSEYEQAFYALFEE